MELIKTVYKDLLKYKDYIIYISRSEMKAESAGSFFGYLWWVLDPLMYMLIYMLIVMVIFQRGDQTFPIFVFCALIPWKWTMTVIANSADSIKGKSGILQQVYFPKFIFPLVRLIIQTVKFFFGLILLLIMVKLFKIKFTLYILGFFLIFFTHFIFLFSITLFVSHLGVFFKDIKNIIGFASRLWFYLSPGLYGLDRVPEKLRFIWMVNPITTFFESYRNVFMYGKPPLYLPLFVWTIISLVLIYLGLANLYKYDKNYMKVI